MKIFAAMLATESNTASPILTGEQSFEEVGLYFGDATEHEPKLFAVTLAAWRQRAEAIGAEWCESVSAMAQPGGPTVHGFYTRLRDRIVSDLEAAGPVDMVLLCLHGAMVSTKCLDCEGDLLERVRQVVGPEVPIGVELDLHTHLSQAMLDNATVMVFFKEYPHVDIAERAEEVFDITLAAARGEVRPVMSTYDCRMINRFPTSREPMRSFVDRMSALEGQGGVLSVSFIHGFAFGNVPEVGARMLVVSDNDAEGGAALAAKLGRELWDMRFTACSSFVGMDEALDQAVAASEGPVVLADSSDNAGSGGPSDTTFVLRRILERGIGDVVSGFYWDPIAVRFCQEAGEGERIPLRFGGKACRDSGEPIDLDVEIRKILPVARQSLGDTVVDMGASVWVSHGDIDLVLNSVRTQVLSPEGFSQFGIDLAARKLVVVKSIQHFHAGFAPIARQIIYSTPPGPTVSDFTIPRYGARTTPYWPLTEDPFTEG
ncbi:MAG: M81 family metallopeptidase [Alphaproteobacteria bacterium]|jgi:microcystin degradation protein MlrC|nr:microcystin LR degradation protein MlrC-like protein [Rhodospirillaceae bacterium]MDP6406284.1 M81 family metallopeptidase [Alphaproteobacteria bacterium]MDP6622761.1 M81 family metallopeptidase [Alphaproteobacteria bacterium]|tara:strand:+ start:161 stop:1621 length:1461 start_codon:yes stop_codon:yes gene_type:complete